MKRYYLLIIYILSYCFAVTACISPPVRHAFNLLHTNSSVSATNGLTSHYYTQDSTGTTTQSSSDTFTSEQTDLGTDTITGTTTSLNGSTSSRYATTSTAAPTVTTTKTYPKPDTGKEMRTVWVSYIELNNMLKNKSAGNARAVIDGIMENAKSYGLNAVIFHVRANSDAYYKSKIFNSAAAVKTLIDTEGFDPLTYAVQAAHSRGLELHAWVNPYRIGSSTSYAKCSDYFASGGKYYYNPASSAAQKLILDGIDEIVRNYDVDGIQFDDYFYPDDENVIPESSPAAFEKSDYEGGISIGDWRRSHVSQLIASTYSKVHNARKNCVFGVSPGSNLSHNYSKLYADIAAWIKQKGYVDYICPQIYFGFLNKSQPFESTVNSWAAMNRHSSVRLYIGLALYKTGLITDTYAGDGKQEWATNDDIMKRSLLCVRENTACGGVMFFSYTYFNPSSQNDADRKMDVAIREVNNLLAVLRQ